MKKPKLVVFTLPSPEPSVPPEKFGISPDWVASIQQMGSTDTTTITTKGGKLVVVMGTFTTVLQELS